MKVYRESFMHYSYYYHQKTSLKKIRDSASKIKKLMKKIINSTLDIVANLRNPKC